MTCLGWVRSKKKYDLSSDHVKGQKCLEKAVLKDGGQVWDVIFVVKIVGMQLPQCLRWKKEKERKLLHQLTRCSNGVYRLYDVWRVRK